MAERGRPVDAETRARIQQLHKAGRKRNEIARELSLSPSTVSKICGELGLNFDRSSTAAAVEAHQIDAKARRAALVARGYKRAETLYERLEAPSFSTLVKQFGGAEATLDLEFVPTPNERDIAQAISTHLTVVAKLEALDSDNGVSDEKSLLAALGAKLGVHGPTVD